MTPIKNRASQSETFFGVSQSETQSGIFDQIVACKTLSKEYQALNIIISTGRSKELLGRNVTIKELDEMSSEQIEAYHKIYELNYSDKVSSSLNGAIISLYSYAVNKVVPIDDVEQLQADLNNSYILTHELKNITGGLARIGGKIWSLVELGLTTVKHIKVKTFFGEIKEECKDVVKCEPPEGENFK